MQGAASAGRCTIIGERIRLGAFMKNLFLLVVMCVFAAAAVAQQSLGDVARANRAKKHAAATTKLDDENFARSSTPEPPSKPESDVAKSADADAKKDSADAQKQKND